MRNPLRRNVHGPSRTVLAVLGLITIVVVGFALYLGPTAVNGIPGIDYYNVRVAFDNADTLTLHDHVRIAGVDVGQVANATVTHGTAVVSLQLSPSVRPLRTGTIVNVRPQSAVGTRFVELDPSTTGQPIPNGGLIPASQTRVEVPIDKLFDVFEPHERANAQILLRELGTGFAGRGDDVNTALHDLPPTLSDLQNVSAAIDAAGGLGPFVASAQGAANAADPVRFDIADGFHPQAQTLGAIADNPGSVTATLDVAPSTLTTADRGLHEASPLLAAVARFAHVALPALRVARGALVQTTLLLQQGRPGLRAAPAVLHLLKPATPATLHLLHVVQPVLPDLDTALDSTLPAVTELAGRSCDVNYWTTNWASAVSWGDSYSNYLRFTLVAPDETSISGLGGSEPNINATPYPNPCQAEGQ